MLGPRSARSVSDAATTTLIERGPADNFGVYGVRKMRAQLHRRGHTVARCPVPRLMKAADLRGSSRPTGPCTTVSTCAPDARPDMFDRAFTAAAANRLWV